MILDVLLESTVPGSHWETMMDTEKQLHNIGICTYVWTMGTGNSHRWRVIATPEQEILLRLITDKVSDKYHREMMEIRAELQKQLDLIDKMQSGECMPQIKFGAPMDKWLTNPTKTV